MRARPLPRVVLPLFIACALLRLLAFGIADLAPQEAYYFFYSQHPALSYFDHPPMLAWCLRAVTTLLGPSVFSIRLTPFLITLGTELLFFRLARRLLPSAGAARATLFLLVTPLISIVSFVSLPDVPLLFFWTLTLLQLHRALFEGKRSGWLWGGLTMGLAFDSKYTAIFLPFGLLIYLLFSPRHRRLLRSPWPWISVVLGQLAAAPVYLWNYQNHFASFLFQSAHRASGSHAFTLKYFFGLLGTQTALLLPTLLLAMLGSAWLGYRLLPKVFRGGITPARERPLFLACFFLPLATVFVALSFVSLVKPNWLMPCYLTGSLLALPFLTRRLLRWHFILALVAHVVIGLELFFYPFPITSDDTLFGWRDLGEQVQRLESAHPQAFVFSADDYKTTAELSFYLKQKIYAGNVLGLPALQFDYIGDDLTTLTGREALFLDSQPRDLSPDRPTGALDPRLLSHFDQVIPLEPILIRRSAPDGAIVRKFLVYHCIGYHP